MIYFINIFFLDGTSFCIGFCFCNRFCLRKDFVCVKITFLLGPTPNSRNTSGLYKKHESQEHSSVQLKVSMSNNCTLFSTETSKCTL